MKTTNATPARTRAQIVADLAEANAAVDKYLTLSREAGSENLSVHYEGMAEGPSQWGSQLEQELRDFDAARATADKHLTEIEAARMLLAQAECAIREPFAPLPALAAFDAMVAKAETADAVCLAASREALALSDALAAKASALDALVEAAGKVSWMPEAGYVVTDAQWDALRAALTAAKAAQVSK